MPYRNPKLLALARLVPHCAYCGAENEGQIVACHSNQQKHGKGMGLKAHDIPAYLCRECHDIVDGRINPGLIEMTKKDREYMLLMGVFESWRMLMELGLLHVSCGSCKCGEAA